VAGIERNGATQKPDDRDGLLVGQDLGVGQPRAVVDGDVDVFPAGLATPNAGRVGTLAIAVSEAANAGGRGLCRRSGRAF
jgi:hypothetical protein